MTNLDPNIWGPHYWFFLHTIAMSYPIHPNAVTKKKYYDFVQNIPLFIPVGIPIVLSIKTLLKWYKEKRNNIKTKTE